MLLCFGSNIIFTPLFTTWFKIVYKTYKKAIPDQMAKPLNKSSLQFECCFASVVSSSSLQSSPKEKMDRDLKLFMLHSAGLLPAALICAQWGTYKP